MKIYRLSGISRVTINFSLGLLSLLGIVLLLFDMESSILYRLIGGGMALFFITCFYFFNKLSISIDEEKIEIQIPLFKQKQILHWNEVQVLIASFTDAGYVRLIPKSSLGKKDLHIFLFGMSIELLRDIVLHLPLETKIYFDERMKRKLEGKQTLFYRMHKGYEVTKDQLLESFKDYKHTSINLKNHKFNGLKRQRL